MGIKYLIALLLTTSFGACLYGQSPAISYSASLTFNVGTTISPVLPKNTGGAVPATVYGQVSTFAGSGISDWHQGTGINASFKHPVSAAFDASGNLYVDDRGNFSIRKITPAGVVTSVSGDPGRSGFLDGDAATAFYHDPAGVALDAKGNIYVADRLNFRIRKISTDGIVSTFAGSATKASTNGTGASASFTDPSAITIDGLGNLFVIDANLIRKVTLAGVVTTFAGTTAAGAVNGKGTVASFNAPAGIAADATGNVYVADLGNNLVRKITAAGVVTTLAGTAVKGWLDGSALTAKFSNPTGVGVDNIGNVYVADLSNQIIRRINTGGIVSTVAGGGYSGWIDGLAIAAKFTNPTGVTPDNNGNIYIADRDNNRIRKVTLTGYEIIPALPAGLKFDSATGSISGQALVASPSASYTITAYNKSGKSSTVVKIAAVIPAVAPSIVTFWPRSLSPGQSVSITGANLAGVSGITIGGKPAVSFHVLSPTNVAAVIAPGAISGSIVVTNPYGSATISGFKVLTSPQISYSSTNSYKTGAAIDPLKPINKGGDVPAAAYNQVTTYAGSGHATGFKDGTSSQALFYAPFGIAFDDAGNLFVADRYNRRIRRVDTMGTVTTFAGNGLSSIADGFTTDASITDPIGVAADPSGNMYVAQYASPQVRKISPAGLVSTLAGGLLSGYTDGTGSAATFGVTNAVATDPTGNIYIADGAEIRKITPAGVVTTFAGSYFSGLINATGTSARFGIISGLAFDAAGTLYVTDPLNHLIRKVTPGGVVSTFAGQAGKKGIVNGNLSTATLQDPAGITVDASGNVYFSEDSGIRMITPAGIVSTVTGANAEQGSLKNGDASIATFTTLSGIAFDKFGNLFIADIGNGAIRKLSLTGYAISPALPVGLIFDATTGIITGTPTVVMPATNYTVTAYNAKGNSSATFSISTYTIGTKVQTITFPTLTAAVYGGADIIPAAKASSALPVSYTSSNTKVATITDGKIHITGAGTTTISVLQTGNATYAAAAVVTQTLTVKAAPLIITADNKSKYFSDPNPVLTAAYSGFVNGDTQAVVTTLPVLSTSVTTSSPEGSYPITLSGALAANYAITYRAGTFTVKPAPVPTITSVVPATAARGTTVTITGAYLSGAIRVTFGGFPATSFKAIAPGTLTAVVAGGGSGSTAVATASGTAKLAGFTFLATPKSNSLATMAAPAAKDLSVNTYVDPQNNNVTLSMDGADTYNVKLNGNSYTTANGELTIPLAYGVNNLEVSTDKLSQGVVTKSITIADKSFPFPNPFNDVINVNLGRDVVKNAVITIYDANNKAVFSNSYANNSGIVQLNAPGLSMGLYVLKVTADGKKTVYKLIKQ